MIKTLILDFEGTIADTRTSVVSTLEATIEAMHLQKPSRVTLESLTGLPFKEMIARATCLEDDEKLEEANLIYSLLYDKISLNTVKLFPDVIDSLKVISDAGIKIVVVSDQCRKCLEKQLRRLGIMRYVDLVRGVEDIEYAKPAPDLVCEIMAITESHAYETLVVGDTTYDVEMGNRAHCITCAVSYGCHTGEQLREKNPMFVMNRFLGIEAVCIKSLDMEP